MTMFGSRAAGSTRPRSRVLLVLAGALIAAVALTGCGGEQVVAGQPAPEQPTAAPRTTWDPVALEAVTDTSSREFVRAARAFRACDKQTWSAAGPAPCLKQVATETAVVDDLLSTLEAYDLPAEKSGLQASLNQLSKSGARVAAKCAKNNDQTCDKALTGFRADEQSVLWDLDASL